MIVSDEYFGDWCSDNASWMEEEFLSKIPPEDLPLDDDTYDYLNNSDDFYEYKKKCFEERDRGETR